MPILRQLIAAVSDAYSPPSNGTKEEGRRTEAPPPVSAPVPHGHGHGSEHQKYRDREEYRAEHRNRERKPRGRHGDDEPSERSKKLEAVLKAVLPFLFFNLCTAQGWKDYMDHITEGSVAKLLQWLPFLLVMVLQNVDERLAIWTAFGAATLVVLSNFVHHIYKPIYAMFYWLPSFNLMAFLAMGIAYEMEPFDWKLIGSISVSSMFLADVCSILVCHPFTMQLARPKVTEEVAKSCGFYKLNVFLSFVWLILFALMAACSWLGHQLDLPQKSAGDILLNTVMPIVIPVAGGKVVTPMAAKWWMEKHGMSLDPNKENKENDHPINETEAVAANQNEQDVENAPARRQEEDDVKNAPAQK